MDTGEVIRYLSRFGSERVSRAALIGVVPPYLLKTDLPAIDVPTVVIHGDADRILPIDPTARRLPALTADCEPVEIAGAPHGLLWTHGAEVNAALLAFVGSPWRPS
jgi:pimeloyl-ACP methyl ester carboxylesterase